VIPYSIGSSADSVFVSGITLLPGGAGATKPRLWKLSATALTPTLLGEFDNPPMDVTGVDGGAFFWVREPYCSYPGFCAPVEIWKTDGTAAGTVRVGNVGSTCPSVSNYFLLHNPTDGGNGRFYFTLYDPFSGDELYVSDGTAAGTHMVADINPGADPQFECPSPHSSSPHELTLVGNLLYFAASEPDHGTELWRTDGTATGTVLVKDINPGPNGSSPSSLANVNGILLFSADDGVHGSELWVSDGTEAGTQLFTDIAAGAQSSSPAEMTVAGSRVFLVANDGEHGRELWAVPLAALPPTLTPTPASFTPVSTGTPTPTPGPSPCVGDCNGDEQVTVDEILTLVNMALGNGGTCGQGAVVGDVPDITFIVQAVNNALDGCVPVTAAHVQHTRPPMRVIPD
jgi:ELWxxDGT repeat protein